MAITWNNVKDTGITKQQFDALDKFDGNSDEKIESSVWTQAQKLLNEAKKNGCAAVFTSTQRRLANILGLKIKPPKVSYSDKYGHETIRTEEIQKHLKELEKEGKRAIIYLEEHGNLDGFELNSELLSCGFNVSIEIETLYDDTSNDKAVARKDEEGDYVAELIEVSDGVSIVIRYVHEDGSSYVTTADDRSRAGEQERIQKKKPKHGV